MSSGTLIPKNECFARLFLQPGACREMLGEFELLSDRVGYKMFLIPPAVQFSTPVSEHTIHCKVLSLFHSNLNLEFQIKSLKNLLVKFVFIG
jgi:hypothetical protein